jgi:hypothetical protein
MLSAFHRILIIDIILYLHLFQNNDLPNYLEL